MAIDPKLVSIKTASELPTATPTSEGQFFFFEGNQMKKAPMTDIYDKVKTAYMGIATTATTPPPTGAYWYKVDTAGTYTNFLDGGSPIVVSASDFDDGDGNYYDVFLEVKDNISAKRLSKKTPVDYSISELDSVSKNKAETGSTIFDFTKREIATINLFNKKGFKENTAFNPTNGNIISSNASNGISDLIKVEGNTLYGLGQKGLNESSIIALYFVEYDENKNFISYKSIQSIATIKTSLNTRFVRLNPNSFISDFEFWKNNFVFAKIGNFPLYYLPYNVVDKPKFQGDLSFFEKSNFTTVDLLSSEGVSFQNETLKITSGAKDFYGKRLFQFTTSLKNTGNCVVVTKIKGNFEEILPILFDQNDFYTTTDQKPTEINYFFGEKDEFFIVTKNNFDKNLLFVWEKEMRLNITIENEINLKIEQFILYLDDSGKPRNLSGVTDEQLQTLANQIQSLSNSVPTTISQQISSQVPEMINQQIGVNMNDYFANHLNDFTFLQPNYIQANSTFKFNTLTSAMNGKFISIIEDVDLQGATIDFVALGVKNLKLVFNGGRILNGKIKSNYTRCIFNSDEAFVNVEILNQFQNDHAIPEWFGAKIDGIDGGIGNFTKDDSFAMNQALKFASKVVLSGNRTMIIKKPIILRSGNIIEADQNFEVKLGDASNCTLLKNEHVDIPHDGVNQVVYPSGFQRNRNITIRGGIWNGNGLKQRRYDSDTTALGNMPDVIGTPIFADGDTSPYFGSMMKFADIDNLLVENLTLKNGRTYMICAGGLFNYVFQNITQIRTHYIMNGDGIHLHGHCYSGIIQDIKGQSGDDFVAVTTSEAGRLSIRVGDVIGLKIRNLYHYSLAVGATPSNPLEITNGIPPNTTTKRCVRLTYTDHIIDDVTIENLRQYNGDFMVLVGMSYLHHNLFSGTNGKIGNIIIKGLKDDNGTSPISVGAKTKVDHITVKDVYMKVESTVEMPAIFKQSDNFGGGDQWALTEVGTLVMDNVYVLKGNSMYASPDGLVWMVGKIKNIFINNLVVETKLGVPKFRALFSGPIDNVSITNSNIDLTEIHSTNGNATTNLTFREYNNEFNSAVIGVVPKRAITESLVMTSNPTNPKLGDKILKSDGIYLFTNAWNKL